MDYKLITIDISDALTRSDIHDVLTETLELPEYYGRNLDALYDCLSEKSWSEKVVFEMVGFRSLPENICRYGETILSIFDRVARENSVEGAEIFVKKVS